MIVHVSDSSAAKAAINVTRCCNGKRGTLPFLIRKGIPKESIDKNGK